jgi:Tol biopolymer transport system component
VDRPVWNTIKDMKPGETYIHTKRKSELYRGEQVTYYAPFTKCDRIEDYRHAWAHFEKRFKDLIFEVMQNIIAIIWDFDKTLVDGYMQDPIFEEYKVNASDFWKEVNSLPSKYLKEQGVKVIKTPSI